MKKRELTALLLAICLLTGCGGQAAAPGETEAHDAQTAVEGPAQTEAAETTSRVADASQMTTVEDVVEEGMTPVYADELADGVYDVTVDSSSSMFKITDCELTVDGGAMTAVLTLSGSSYGYLYAGTAEEAAAADPSAYIEPGETADGRNTFVLPVEALDAGVQCAAWSRNKELWYDRTLVFRADSLPLDAFKMLTNAESLGLAEGEYTVEVALAGGSGKASVQSPAKLTVESGRVTAEIVWSSPNYDAMLANGMPYDPINTEGNSTFLLDVLVFDRPVAVQAETIAMSQPHWIDYTLTFDSESIAVAQP